ncbi:MAG: transaldolase family protein [Leptolyngbyaceae cyanobacterium MO_188.B28]|nr:transaldolase family protein [Leptolyngbyaceae cyanobacterium MO_188.B28]
MSSSPNLRLYLDSADTDEWRAWMPTGLFYGITSNPLLLERAQVKCDLPTLKKLAQEAFQLGAQEMQLQTWGDSVEDLVSTGKQLAAIDPRVVVKSPITRLGTTAASQLIAAGVRVTLTAVYSVHQVLIAAALGADYVAPYLGRINDAGGNGRETVTKMQQALTGVKSPTRLLTASIRDIEDISVLATQGLDTFTFSAKIAAAFFNAPATETATADFARAVRNMGG